MQLDQHAVEAVPHQLDKYDLVDSELALAYKKINLGRNTRPGSIVGVVHSYVHFGDNPYSDQSIQHMIEICCQQNNGINNNFVALHSHQLPNQHIQQLEKEHINFRYYYMPTLAFCQIQYHIDFNTPISMPSNFDRKYSALLNRHTGFRYKLFEHLQQNNLLDQGYVSYRNVQRHPSDKRADMDHPYRNFDETHYPLEHRVNPRQFVYYYPVHNFLFDFTVETFVDSETLLLTEKSYKPFYWYKIPLLAGGVGNMHHLESLGFDIFRDIIDHSYDLEKDRDARMRAFVKQVSTVLEIDINQIDCLQSRLQKNHDRFCDLVKLCDGVLHSIEHNITHIINYQ